MRLCAREINSLLARSLTLDELICLDAQHGRICILLEANEMLSVFLRQRLPAGRRARTAEDACYWGRRPRVWPEVRDGERDVGYGALSRNKESLPGVDTQALKIGRRLRYVIQRSNAFGEKGEGDRKIPTQLRVS